MLEWLPPVYQNMVNLNVGFPTWRYPSIFMNPAMRDLISHKLSLPTVGLKPFSLPIYPPKFPTGFAFDISGIYPTHVALPHRSCQFYPLLGA
jgi:hypothetical protein